MKGQNLQHQVAMSGGLSGVYNEYRWKQQKKPQKGGFSVT